MADLAINKTHIILVNALVEKNGKILVSQRSWEETNQPGKWTIPGGKIERTKGNVWNILEKTVAEEVKEETGVQINSEIQYLTNNTFIRSTGQHVVALNFLCHWKKGEARPLEDTIDVKWIFEKDVDTLDFAPNVKIYISQGFAQMNRAKKGSK